MVLQQTTRFLRAHCMKVLYLKSGIAGIGRQGLVIKCSACRLNWNLQVLVFVKGRKPENPEKNPRSKARTNNKLNPHETVSAGIEPAGHRGGTGAGAYPLRHPCSFFVWSRAVVYF